MALLGNTPDAYGQTWHLPCDDNRLTYKEFIQLAAKHYKAQRLDVNAEHNVLNAWVRKLAELYNPLLRDASELLPSYKLDNIFVSDKFKARFPEFEITTYEEGLKVMAEEKANA